MLPPVTPLIQPQAVTNNHKLNSQALATARAGENPDSGSFAHTHKINCPRLNRGRLTYNSLCFLALNLPGTAIAANAPEITAAELKPGGNTTMPIQPFASFVQPAANMGTQLKANFYAGKALAHQPWVKAPSITNARDGLGPIYNARTCLACHINGGRGEIPSGDQMLTTGIVRLSIPGQNKIHGVIAEPTYGDQLQSQSTAVSHQLRHIENIQTSQSDVVPEAYVYINWHTHTFSYPDGSQLELRKPSLRFEKMGYGDFHPQTLFSLRNAPPLLGSGLLELIPQQAINQKIDKEDKNRDGISGRLNRVWDFEKQQTVAGRFGHKANKANLRQQLAAALNGDMGISSPIFPYQPCTQKQLNCNKATTGNDNNGHEISADLLNLMVNFNMNLAVPERRKPEHPMVMQGRSLFYQINCQGCHTPEYTTAKSNTFPHLSEQSIWPYTDLLLHDMGEGLADNRPDYLATGREWRTPPLWGAGLSKAVNGNQQYLHDGRARTIEEAILWHGGEAENSRQRFIRLTKQQRQALIAFVKSL